jgi:hypothetical protein
MMTTMSSSVAIDGVAPRAGVLAAAAGSFVPDTGDRLRVYRTGQWGDLVDKPVSSLAVHKGQAGRISVESRDAWDSVDLGGPVVPAYVRGRVTGLDPSANGVVVALNGRIAAVCAVSPGGSRDFDFGALLPPSQLRQGKNSLRFFAMVADAGVTPLDGS